MLNIGLLRELLEYFESFHLLQIVGVKKLNFISRIYKEVLHILNLVVVVIQNVQLVVLHLNIRVLYLHKYVCVSILQHVLLLFSFRVVLQNQSLDHIYHQKVNAVDLIVIILEIIKLLDLAHLRLLGRDIFCKV